MLKGHAPYTILLPSGALLLAALSTFAVSAQDNPFAFKPKEPEVVSAPAPVIVEQDPNLTQEQRSQVADMIQKTLDSIKLKDEGAKTATVEDSKYVILSEGERVSGVTSGMFAVYSDKTMDFEYYDTRKYKKVITEAEYDDLVSGAKARTQLVVDTIKEGLQNVTGTPVETKKRGIQPVNIK